ncbi:MAG: TlpA family protein disulfide reductase, partial [Bdellovibrionales bacterium]|nr:TlpA family protein disulfide reductase [Bdellovibrionales bacterium]
TIFFALIAMSLGARIFGPKAKVLTKRVSSSSLIEPVTIENLKAQFHAHHQKLTLVNFWATWCEPCKEEFPTLLKLRQKYQDKGLYVYFVSVDESKNIPHLENYLKSLHVDFPTGRPSGDEDGVKMISQLSPGWHGVIPTSLFFDAAGNLVQSYEGPLDFKDLEKIVTQLLHD